MSRKPKRPIARLLAAEKDGEQLTPNEHARLARFRRRLADPAVQERARTHKARLAAETRVA